MKTLNTIQTLSKIGKIFSKIAFICSIIGAAGCIIGMVCLPFGDTGIFKIGGVTVYGLIGNEAETDLDSLYPVMSGAMIFCVGEAVLAKFAELYFAHELAAGTPFTEDGAGEMLRLGILTVCIPIGAFILARIVSAVIENIIGCGEVFDIGNEGSVALGVMFIVMSLLCRYGAELRGQKQNESAKTE